MTQNKSTPEPAPVHVPGGKSLHDLVCEDLHDRKRFGIGKYGTILQVGNGRDAQIDAYQEVLDMAVYLRQHLEERKIHWQGREVRIGKNTRRLEYSPFGDLDFTATIASNNSGIVGLVPAVDMLCIVCGNGEISVLRGDAWSIETWCISVVSRYE